MGKFLSGTSELIKRLVDLSLSIVAIILLWPIALVVAIAIILSAGRPIIFSQIRPGMNAKPFKLYKFRTMKNLYDTDGHLLPDCERITRLGNLLRATSLDELPNLWAIIKGDMSIVGPRPLLMEYLDLYNEEQAKRHNVKPGLTGWAQVKGRNAITWEEKFKLDVWYVNNHSVLLDFKIMLLTVKKVFFSEGISADGEATMPKFKGSE